MLCQHSNAQKAPAMSSYMPTWVSRTSTTHMLVSCAGITTHLWQKPKISFLVIPGHSWLFLVIRGYSPRMSSKPCMCWACQTTEHTAGSGRGVGPQGPGSPPTPAMPPEALGWSPASPTTPTVQCRHGERGVGHIVHLDPHEGPPSGGGGQAVGLLHQEPHRG